MVQIKSFALSLVVLGLLDAASAHFTISAPPSRGFDSAKAEEFCGGFSTTSSPRTPFNPGANVVEISSSHGPYEVQISFTPIPNPTTFNQFTPSSGGYVITNFSTVSTTGAACLPVNLGSITNFANGTVGTIQVAYMAGDGSLYQCSDVVLTNDAPVVTCQNSTTTANHGDTHGDGSDDHSHSDASATGSASSPTGSSGGSGSSMITASLGAILGAAGLALLA